MHALTIPPAALRDEKSVHMLGAWIADPQHMKPGNYMPKMPLQSDELIAILHYLEQLK